VFVESIISARLLPAAWDAGLAPIQSTVGASA
jgi:hypothetical protein